MGLYHKQILGTVAETQQKRPITSIELADFPDELEIVFRFKVVDFGKKLLGEVDGIRTGEPVETGREPLISSDPDRSERGTLVSRHQRRHRRAACPGQQAPAERQRAFDARPGCAGADYAPNCSPSACDGGYDGATIRAVGGKLD